jgi:hypothetical protein
MRVAAKKRGGIVCRRTSSRAVHHAAGLSLPQRRSRIVGTGTGSRTVWPLASVPRSP